MRIAAKKGESREKQGEDGGGGGDGIFVFFWRRHPSRKQTTFKFRNENLLVAC